MGRMSMLHPLVHSDPASPRLTVYDEATGARQEFSGVTLDNWANKIANMLVDEFDATADTTIIIDMPVSWQAAVIGIGTFAAALTPLFTGHSGTLNDDAPAAELVFATVDGFERWPDADDVVVVSNDPFGRGVEESGGQLPFGTVDFGPTVRFYGDHYFGESCDLSEFAEDSVGPERWLVTNWSSTSDFRTKVLAPLAAGGSVVIVAGIASADRLDAIAETEKVTARKFS